MTEYFGIGGPVPSDAEIQNELTCAGREASCGFDVIVGLYGRFSNPAMMAFLHGAVARGAPRTKREALPPRGTLHLTQLSELPQPCQAV